MKIKGVTFPIEDIKEYETFKEYLYIRRVSSINGLINNEITILGGWERNGLDEFLDGFEDYKQSLECAKKELPTLLTKAYFLARAIPFKEIKNYCKNNNLCYNEDEHCDLIDVHFGKYTITFLNDKEHKAVGVSDLVEWFGDNDKYIYDALVEYDVMAESVSFSRIDIAYFPER